MTTTDIYLEQRKASGTSLRDNVTADITRHLYARQYLGKAVIFCEQPINTMSSARKQWLRLARSLQRQRSSTLNADKILKYTQGIAHMQHLHFSAKTPIESPSGDIFFVTDTATRLPAQCFTLYLTVAITKPQAQQLIAQLPQHAIIVDYLAQKIWKTTGVAPKKDLERGVTQEWRQVCQFLDAYGINARILQKDGIHNVEVMDNALDILLGRSHAFLQTAGRFQRTLELARPIHLPKATREKYDAFVLLAHRVQALTPGAFGKQFLQVYNEDDTFFMYDLGKELLLPDAAVLTAHLNRHRQAGRHHLAEALLALHSAKPLRHAT